jgi:hypothetical protein
MAAMLISLTVVTAAAGEQSDSGSRAESQDDTCIELVQNEAGQEMETEVDVELSNPISADDFEVVA